MSFSEAVVTEPGVASGEPISPELMLVSSPEIARMARQQLPDREPFDEWLRRVRLEETKRVLRSMVAELRAEQRRAEQRRSAIAGAAFAAACVVLSVLPVIVFAVGA